MDRSLTARASAGRRRATGLPRTGLRWPGPGALRAGAGAQLNRAAVALRAHRRVRVALICAIVAAPLLAGGWLWLRHSSLVAVEHVRISGAHGPEAHAIETALREAAKGMSTLDAKPAELRAAVQRFPAVSAVRESTSFPHSMRIFVTQQPAVAALLVGGTRTAIAADGTVLGTALLSPTLPTVADDVAPGPGSEVSNTLVLAALQVLGAAPKALDRLAEKAYFGPRGLTVQMRDGLLVYFGDALRPHAKWLSMASVLADKTASAGAIYVDVRLPGRPAAGFPPGGGPARPEEEATGEALHGSAESTVSALAAGLAAANPEAKKSESEETGKESEEGGKSSEASSGEASSEGSHEAEGGGGESPTSGPESGG